MDFKAFLFVLTAVCQVNVTWGSSLGLPVARRNVTAQSCLDYLKRGYKTNGYYHITNHGTNGLVHTVYCDFESEPGSAWTLVESFALKNKLLLPAFYYYPLGHDFPVNPSSPNWNLFRMSLLEMNHLCSQSTHWRVTCSFPTKPVNIYRDYVRANFNEFDVLAFEGTNVCKKMEYINVRGHHCARCTAGWNAVGYKWSLHLDGTSTSCYLNAKKDAVPSEDDFGHYGIVNKKFRCSSSPEATTNYWFGGFKTLCRKFLN